MSDLGLLSYYLGIEVKQEEGKISICKSAYANKILEMAGMKGCNSCATPMENRLKLSKHGGGDLVDATRFPTLGLTLPMPWELLAGSWRNQEHNTGKQ